MSNEVVYIPAKGYSSRFHGCKNLAVLQNVPLIDYTISYFLNQVAEVVVITDSDDIQERAISKGAQSYLAPLGRTAIESVASFVHHEKFQPDQFIWMALPTAPFRQPSLIHEFRKLLTDLKSVGVEGPRALTVTELDFPSDLTLRSVSKSQPLENWQSWLGDTQRQNFPTYYRPNGQLYGATFKAFAETNSFYGPNLFPLETDPRYFCDIDTMEDLRKYERLLEENKDALSLLVPPRADDGEC